MKRTASCLVLLVRARWGIFQTRPDRTRASGQDRRRSIVMPRSAPATVGHRDQPEIATYIPGVDTRFCETKLCDRDQLTGRAERPERAQTVRNNVSTILHEVQVADRGEAMATTPSMGLRRG